MSVPPEVMGAPAAATTRDLASRAVVHVEPGTSVREAAIAMTAHDTSLACVSTGGELVGVVTDHDLRTRVVAAGRGLRTTVGEVMTPEPCTIAADGTGYEAMLVMLENDIRHLPVVDGDRVIGIVSAADLFRDHHGMDAVRLARRIARTGTVGELATVMGDLPDLQDSLLEAQLPPGLVGRTVTGVVDACTRHLLQMAERRLGPPPCPYVWFALGSHARGEMSIGSDQDNALVLDELPMDDEFALADAEQYFSELARRVTSGLEVCGIQTCARGHMATNPRWRQPIGQWREYYRQWMVRPDREELAEATVFLDVRPVHGDEDLAAQLMAHIAALLRKPRGLVRALSADALRSSPPLGRFRTFALSRDEQGQKVLDIRSGGIGPVVDIARVYALAAGSLEPGTRERLAIAQREGLLAPARARDLLHALDGMVDVRLRHRHDRKVQGQVSSDQLAPEAMDAHEQGELKEALALVRDAQAALRQAVAAGTLG